MNQGSDVIQRECARKWHHDWNSIVSFSPLKRFSSVFWVSYRKSWMSWHFFKVVQKCFLQIHASASQQPRMRKWSLDWRILYSMVWHKFNFLVVSCLFLRVCVRVYGKCLNKLKKNWINCSTTLKITYSLL